jgi:DNA replication and repair protein RecF
MVRQGAPSGVIRSELVRDGRTTLVEAELSVDGRDRVQVNRRPLRRARDLLGTLRVTVFTPDDLSLVKGGPSERRRYLDDLLVATEPRLDAVRRDVDRALRQRNALLRQVGGRLDDSGALTLDVWDKRLAAAGERLVDARRRLVDRLGPLLVASCDRLGGTPSAARLSYRASWEGSLAAALSEGRAHDLRRGVSTIGPHRDDVEVSLGGLPARLQASQGEQRSLALGLRLAGHDLVTEVTDRSPLLLLDDVFSELDDRRAAALVALLPEGQSVLTTATALPPGIQPGKVVEVTSDGLR